MFPKSLILFIILIVGLIIGQYSFIVKESQTAVNSAITQTTQSANLTVTKLFINNVYPEISHIVRLKENTNPKNGLEGEDLNEVDSIVRNFMFGTDILKIKLLLKKVKNYHQTRLLIFKIL